MSPTEQKTAEDLIERALSLSEKIAALEQRVAALEARPIPSIHVGPSPAKHSPMPNWHPGWPLVVPMCAGTTEVTAKSPTGWAAGT